jgi:PAS domain S-box-containing protein
VDFFSKLFDTSDFPPRWHCGLWTPGHGWLHILSDLGVWSAYLAIPCVLGFFALRRKDVPFRNIFWLFGAFILANGTTHLMEAIIFWWPAYRLAGLIKLFTAIVSWATVIALVLQALAMRSPEELEREIAERKQAEEAQRRLQHERDELLARLQLQFERMPIGELLARLQLQFERMPIGCAIADPGLRIIDWNPAAEKIFGFRREEVLGMDAYLLVPPASRAYVQGIHHRLASGDLTAIAVNENVTKDGRTILCEWFNVPLRNADGELFAVLGMAQDVTERKRAEEALRESEERFRGTFENAAVGVAHKDAEGCWLCVNEKYCEIVGYTREELLQRTFKDITYPEDLAAELERYTSLMRGELPSYSLEKRYIRKDGSLVWSDVTISLQRDVSGKPAYAIAILQDISDRKRLEGELRQAKETAESANRAKDEFLANVSHEIRTPMNAILGMIELVLDTPLTEDQRQCLTTVKSAADNLLGLINDLLDFSKIAAGKLELAPTDFSLRVMLGDTLRALAMRAHRKGLELVCNLEPDVPDALVGDAGRLRQVLLNLVGNAIKFTEKGEVVMHVEVAGDPAPQGEVGLRFAVSDTGIGIPPDKQETIFRAFEQEDASTTRKYGGTGLGLTIAARLVALMGGTITVHSEPDRGSTFAFTARFGRPPHPPEPIAARPPILLHNLPVLIIDDNATNRHILEEWLRGWQMKPAAVGDGVAAMDALWYGATCGRPDALVLLDARMPDTDGLALAARIRQRAELSTTRIILLTSEDRRDDQTRIRELHIDAYLLKPVQQDELLATIYRVMSRTDGDAPPVREPAEASAPAVAPLRILVAEDNEFNTRHLERLLVRRGHRVRLANNGREALALLGIEGQESEVSSQESEARGEKSLSSLTPDPCPLTTDFDLLLLDVHMPKTRRLPGRPSDPGAGASRGGTFARHCLDGMLAARRPRALPRGRHGRLPREAGSDRGTVRGHRPGGLRPRSFPAGSAGCGGPHESARPGRLAGGLRRRCGGAARDVPRFPRLCARPPGRGGRRPPGPGRAAVARGRAQALWAAVGVLHGGRSRGVGSRRLCGLWPTRRGPAAGWTARNDGSGTEPPGGRPVARKPAMPGRNRR